MDNDIQFTGQWKQNIPQEQMPKSVYWLTKYTGGLIKNERQANMVLVGVVIFNILVMIYFSFFY